MKIESKCQLVSRSKAAPRMSSHSLISVMRLRRGGAGTSLRSRCGRMGGSQLPALLQRTVSGSLLFLGSHMSEVLMGGGHLGEMGTVTHGE